jgi:hypothetical protein
MGSLLAGEDAGGENRLSSGSGFESLEELSGVDPILERFPTVDEDNGNFVVVLFNQFGIAVDVDLAELEAVAGLEFGELVLDDIAKVASFA